MSELPFVLLILAGCQVFDKNHLTAVALLVLGLVTLFYR